MAAITADAALAADMTSSGSWFCCAAAATEASAAANLFLYGLPLLLAAHFPVPGRLIFFGTASPVLAAASILAPAPS